MFLAMGGIALGKGVISSGLFDVMGKHIRYIIQGSSLYVVVLVLSVIVLVCLSTMLLCWPNIYTSRTRWCQRSLVILLLASS